MFKKANRINTLENNNNHIHFYNLGPNEINKDSIYLKALDHAIKDKDVFNIAITGKYGAGKTSAIKTYEALNQEYKYLNVSLASFKNSSQDKNTSIERSILQQLFYAVAPSEIPYSRFKRIKNIKRNFILKELIISLIIVILLFLSIFLLSHPQFINLTFLKENKQIFFSNYFSNIFMGIMTIIFLLIFIVCVSYILYVILKTIMTTIELSNIKLKKENIEIEVKNNGTTTDSIFNKYLDEIIYFFEATKYDVIVIEDLDRFKNSNEVFIKLRELNKLINDCKTINRKIIFIYSIKDEMFEEKERVKFFDFIIPILPVINSSNSRQKLIDKLKENSIESLLKSEYIRDITLYIDDMRILNNIMNEFNIYRENLNIENLSMENLFSIIVFKNIYPKEFAELQDNKGIICNIFNTKLERLYTYRKVLEKNSKIYFTQINDIDDILNKTNNNTKLSYLISTFGIENLLSADERENNLMTFLLANGYIDENYEEYINYFYPGELKINDKSFIISVKSQNRLNFDYTLREIKEIIQNIPLKSFSQKEILNFDLLDFLLLHQNQYKEPLKLIFEQLKNESDISVEFCTSFMLRSYHLDLFIRNLCNNWTNIWSYINQTSIKEVKELYMYNILRYASLPAIRRINKDNSFAKYIAIESNFIRNFSTENEIKKIKRIILTLNIKFENIANFDINTELGKFIINNNFYKINKHMIYSILKNIYKYDLNIIKRKNYSSILKTKNEDFVQYINNNILEYVKNVYLLVKKAEDDVEDIISLINRDEIPKEFKDRIIQKQSNPMLYSKYINLYL